MKFKKKVKLKKKVKKKSLRPWTSEEDLLMAYRHLYYVRGISLITDEDYDEIEKEVLGKVSESSPLRKPGSDKDSDYPDYIKAFSLYLALKFCKPKG